MANEINAIDFIGAIQRLERDTTSRSSETIGNPCASFPCANESNDSLAASNKPKLKISQTPQASVFLGV